MKFPVIELVDRYAVAVVKYKKTNGANVNEVEFYTAQLNEMQLDLQHPLLQELINHHAYVWSLEDDFKKGRIDKLPLDEIGKIAIQVRDQGYERTRLKNALAEVMNDPIREIKRYNNEF